MYGKRDWRHRLSYKNVGIGVSIDVGNVGIEPNTESS